VATVPVLPRRTKDGVPFAVRSARADDADAVAALLLHVSETTDQVVTLPEERRRDAEAWRRQFASFERSEDALWLLAEADGAPVGSLDFRAASRHRLAHTGDFGLNVHASWRGRGVGRALLDALLSWSRAHPRIEKVALGVFSTNAPAIALYRSMGFREEGRRVAEVRLGPGCYVDNVNMYVFVKPGLPPSEKQA
jgi:RimJ/RimL family protein N-acetyltransferase